MGETITVRNTGRGAIVLPSGREIPGNGSADVDLGEWKLLGSHPIIRSYIESDRLIAAGSTKPTPVDEPQDVDGLSSKSKVAELRAEAERRGIEGVDDMRKADLLIALGLDD